MLYENPKYPLRRPKLQENQNKHLLQVITNMTKLNSFRKCMFGEGHTDRAVRGHIIPKNWLKQISVNDEVRVFSTLPVGILPELPDDYESALARPLKLEHINRATARPFACETHEKEFFTVDSLRPDTSKPQVLNTLCYRPLIAQMWLETLLGEAFRAVLKITPDDEPFRLQARMHHQNIIGLQQYKRLIAPCLDSDTCPRCRGHECKIIGHVVRQFSGEPTLAVSQFSSGSRTHVNFHFGTVKYIANWGLTIIPTPDGQTAILHYFLEDLPHSLEMQETIRDFKALSGRSLEQMISALVLGSCENIAVSPSAWDAFGPKRRSAMLYRFHTEMQDIGFGSSEQVEKWNKEHFLLTEPPLQNPRQLNMFRH